MRVSILDNRGRVTPVPGPENHDGILEAGAACERLLSIQKSFEMPGQHSHAVHVQAALELIDEGPQRRKIRSVLIDEIADPLDRD